MEEMKKTVKIKSKNVSISSERHQHGPLQRVMSFENSTVPMSIFNDDGTMVTCTKIRHHAMTPFQEIKSLA